MIKFYENKKNVADAVLFALKTMTDDSFDGDVFVQPYLNCREQGWYLTVYNKKLDLKREFSFSENRNSDAIVVYMGYGKEKFSEYGVPTDEAYRQAKYFDYMGFGQAAKFMADEIALALA